MFASLRTILAATLCLVLSASTVAAAPLPQTSEPATPLPVTTGPGGGTTEDGCCGGWGPDW